MKTIWHGPLLKIDKPSVVDSLGLERELFERVWVRRHDGKMIKAIRQIHASGQDPSVWLPWKRLLDFRATPFLVENEEVELVPHGSSKECVAYTLLVSAEFHEDGANPSLYEESFSVRLWQNLYKRNPLRWEQLLADQGKLAMGTYFDFGLTAINWWDSLSRGSSNLVWDYVQLDCWADFLSYCSPVTKDD